MQKKAKCKSTKIDQHYKPQRHQHRRRNAISLPARLVHLLTTSNDACSHTTTRNVLNQWPHSQSSPDPTPQTHHTTPTPPHVIHTTFCKNTQPKGRQECKCSCCGSEVTKTRAIKTTMKGAFASNERRAPKRGAKGETRQCRQRRAHLSQRPQRDCGDEAMKR
jgi:hypothetical protein